jgi:MFS family permease
VSEEQLPPTVKLLGGVSLAQDAGSEMLYPFLPTFITGVLGAPVVAVGVAEGLADATAAVMKLVSGRLAGRQRRKPWIALGYGLAAVGKLIVAIALVWPIVLVGRVVDRIGKGIRGVPRDAMIADAVPASMRGRAFGLHRSMDTLGAVIGPLAGLALYQLVGERVRPVLLVALVPAVISVMLIGLVREPPPTAEGDPDDAGSSSRSLPRGFWSVMVPLGVFAVVNSTDALLLQRAHELGLGVTAVVLAYVAYNTIYAVFGYPVGRLVDRFPPRLVYAVGLVVFAVAYIGLGRAGTQAAVWALVPLYGLYAALTDGVARAWIANLVPGEQCSWALGVHGATTGVGVLVAGLWSGLAWGGSGAVPLTISGVVALAVALWLLLSRDPATVR